MTLPVILRDTGHYQPHFTDAKLRLKLKKAICLKPPPNKGGGNYQPNLGLPQASASPPLSEAAGTIFQDTHQMAPRDTAQKGMEEPGILGWRSLALWDIFRYASVLF